jgi:hypothetical protein
MSARPMVLAPARDARCQAWQSRLDRFAASALTVVAFCHREHVSVPAFYYWKRRLGEDRQAPPADAPRLLPVRLTAAPPPVELLLPGGAVLRLTPGCDLDFLRSLLAALGVIPC